MSGQTVYTYTGNDPLDKTDPTGNSGVLSFLEDRLNDIDDFFTSLGPAGLPEHAIEVPLIAGVRGLNNAISGAKAVAADVKASKAETLAANAAQGKAGEAITRASLGEKVAGEQVSFKTSDGTRTRTDFVTKDKGVVETKTGGATLSEGQAKLKADVNAGRSVTPVGQNAANAGLKPGEPTKLPCFSVDHPC